jgi:ferritin
VEYILNRGAKPVTAIPAPTTDPVTVNDCFEKVFEHEVDTKSIYKVVKWHSMKKIFMEFLTMVRKRTN